MLGCACKAQLHSCFFPVSLYSGRERTRQLASSVSSGFSASSPVRDGWVNPFSFPFRPPIAADRKTIEETRLFFNLDHSPPLPQLTYNPYFLTDLSPEEIPLSSILNSSRASRRQSLTILRLRSYGCSLWLFDRLLQF